ARAIDRSLNPAAAAVRPALIAKPGEIITVSGRVLQLSGARVGHLAVAILGQGLAAKTDDFGNFTIPNVRTPYDIAASVFTVTVPYAPAPSVPVSRGLRRPDPHLVVFPGDAESTAVVTGTLSGGAGFPQPAGHFAFVQIGTDGGGMGFSQAF